MKFFKLILLTLLLSVSPLSFAKEYGSVVIDEVTSIYDGDTFTVNINHWPSIVGQRVSIRVNGIDTPEMRGKCQPEKELARKAKQFAVQALRSAKRIELQNIKRGKYFRIVANVMVDGKNLGSALINANLAVAYDGGTKIDWCK